ncbi:hypothetical protein Q1695_013629 [Nippostrongylus brasiliensis]|nr:hypothetical protein Q1695_013629 [Nippostrongylus brasiliensis]
MNEGRFTALSTTLLQMSCPRHTRSLGDCAALIVCPYSRAHHVSPAAFPGHLRSCRLEYLKDNSSNIRAVRCRVDPRHIVPEVELAFHEKHCGDAYFRRINAELTKSMSLCSAAESPVVQLTTTTSPASVDTSDDSDMSDSETSSSFSIPSTSTSRSMSMSNLSAIFNFSMHNTFDV